MNELESVRKLTEQYRMNHNNIPCSAVFGLRNRIVHDHGRVDLTVVYDTLKYDIPALQRMIMQ